MHRGILTKTAFDVEIENLRTSINKQLDYIKDNIDVDSDNNVSIAEIWFILRHTFNLGIRRFRK